MTVDMNETTEQFELHRDVDLDTILAAWNSATDRLQRTHEALRSEVRRLSDELEIKNRELARKNRLADLGQLAAHVAHELRNSLVPMTLYLSLLRRQANNDQASLSIIEKIEHGFTALEVTVNDLLNFTSDRAPQLAAIGLRDLVTATYESVRPQLEGQGIRVEIDVPPDMTLWADREMLRRALLNLVLNAVDEMGQGGILTITAVDTGQGIELEVADDGPGIDDEILPRLFEPFFTQKVHGTGLGLAIVGRVVEAHGGNAQAANCPDGGAAFTLRFPKPAGRKAA